MTGIQCSRPLPHFRTCSATSWCQILEQLAAGRRTCTVLSAVIHTVSESGIRAITRYHAPAPGSVGGCTSNTSVQELSVAVRVLPSPAVWRLCTRTSNDEEYLSERGSGSVHIVNPYIRQADQVIGVGLGASVSPYIHASYHTFLIDSHCLLPCHLHARTERTGRTLLCSRTHSAATSW